MLSDASEGQDEGYNNAKEGKRRATIGTAFVPVDISVAAFFLVLAFHCRRIHVGLRYTPWWVAQAQERSGRGRYCQKVSLSSLAARLEAHHITT